MFNKRIINPASSLKTSQDRLYKLKYHPVQAELWNSPVRFKILHAGRRSGKTEIEGKRKMALVVLKGQGKTNEAPRYFIGAPTRDQVKRIYWQDIKKLIPQQFIADKSESSLYIKTVMGAELYLFGMDKAERIEGTPWDGCLLDEIASMKPGIWEENVRPALADRKGWCSFVGVPEGMNFYYKLKQKAQQRYEEAIRAGRVPSWQIFHWKSSEILDADEIHDLIEDMDPETARQELDGEYVNFGGKTYYGFNRKIHCAPLKYSPDKVIMFCFDFNVSPGVAAVIQEQTLPNGEYGTGVIDEVFIAKNSNTVKVCRKLIEKYRNHKASIWCYGDASGGASGSAKVKGSDWDLIRYELGAIFGNKVQVRIKRKNPSERSRINAVNTRLFSGSKKVRLMVDPDKASNVVEDFECVESLDDGSIKKTGDSMHSHLTDAIGYYIHIEFPISSILKPAGDKDSMGH